MSESAPKTTAASEPKLTTDAGDRAAAVNASSSSRHRRTASPPRRSGLSPRPATLAMVAAAACSLALYRWDPWHVSSNRYGVRADSSGVRRLLPSIVDRDASSATFEFQRPGGEVVRIVPGTIGHQVFEGKTLLGPADPLAVDAIWSSLRIASTVRATSLDTSAGVGEHGIVRVNLPDLRVVIELGVASSDGAGIYGRLKHEGDELWVVESEVSWLVAQPAKAWLARGLLPVDASQLAGVAWAGGVGLSRGVDDLWRATGPLKETGEPDAPRLLASDAVDLRLDRMLTAALDPWLERGALESVAFQPWLSVTTLTGETYNFARGEECPGHPDRWVIDRGPGYLGCLDKNVAAEWELNGDVQGLLDTQLIPYPIGRVLAIELEQPSVRRLRRRSGGWQIDEPQRSQVVDEGEVIRWYELLARSEVEPVEGVALPVDALRIKVETDSTQTMQLRCGVVGEDLFCSRDGAPPMRVVALERPEFSFVAETFAERRLLTFAVEDVRALELIPGGQSGDSIAGATAGIRTSVRQDFGVWQLDAPEHPDGSQGIDTIRLESVLAAMSSLRAIDWKDDLAGVPVRTVRLELTPAQGRPREINVALEDDCVVKVEGGRRARIDRARCEILRGEVFYDDPVRALLLSARSLRVLEASGRERTFASLLNQVVTRDKNGWHLPSDALAGGVEAADEAERLGALVEALERIRGRSLFAVPVSDAGDGTLRSPFEVMGTDPSSDPGEGEGPDPVQHSRDRLVVEIRRSKGNIVVEIEGDRLWMRGRAWGWDLAPPAPVEDASEPELADESGLLPDDDAMPDAGGGGGKSLGGRDVGQDVRTSP